MLASRGLASYYLKHIDVLRLDFFYGKLMFSLGVVALFALSFRSIFVLFIAVYYILLFYLVYSNMPIGRKFLFFLTNIIFIPLVFLV
ncbi:MAG: hypothetical protein JXA66_02845, partial [Oligoflexia bacterium]|nr:hypothetical protein [Oligoflexia bacterium]